MSKSIKLNIGAGVTYLPGFINIDISSSADISLNLNKQKLPFKDDSVDIVFSYHTLEHLENYLFTLGEIYRVLKHRGKIYIGVPYLTLTKYNLVNPYHKQNFNEYSFDFFDPDLIKGSAVESNNILFKKTFVELHYVGFIKYLPLFAKTILVKHILNTVDKIDFGLIAIKNKVDTKTDPKLAIQMKAEFNSYLIMRRLY